MSEHPVSAPRPARVLVGYDGSEYAVRALDQAVDEAVRRGSSLEILCGTPWAPPSAPGAGFAPYEDRFLHRAAGRMLDEAVRRAARHAPELRVTATLSPEPAGEALVAAGENAALVVVGTRGHGGLAGLPLGSVCLRVTSRCMAPVLVVRGDPEQDEKPRGTVLVGIQSERDAPAVRLALREASHRGARVRVVHAWLKPAEGSEESRALDVVAALRADFPEVVVDTERELSAVAPALVAATASSDLAVLAAHRGERRSGMRLGRVAAAVLQQARCPVVVVPVRAWGV